MTDVHSDQSRDQRYAQYVRAANIVICIIGIVYFVSFLEMINARIPWLLMVVELFTQAIIVLPQVFFLLFILILELRPARNVRHHLIMSMNAITVIALGYFWSKGVISAINT